MRDKRDPALALGSVALLGLLVLSGLEPYDRGTWLLEVAPVLIAWPILFATRRRFPLTTLLYVLIFLHACILMLGGAYTYARVPLGFEVAERLGLERNPYDKLGHFFQGLVPALLAREILIRGAFVRGPRMLAFLVVAVALAISASYELVEWAAALALGGGAYEFLGTQGDPWDTQSDMFAALLGALAALVFFARLHDRQIGARTRDALVALHDEVDREARELARRHAGRIHCRRGCHACCVDDLTVTRIEAERIRERHAGLLATAPPHPVGACAFLDGEGACRIYADRPLVCRTQGLPLRILFEDEAGEIEERRDICPLNLEGGPPLEALAEEQCWLVGVHELRLAALDEEAGGSDETRVRLRDLFRAPPLRPGASGPTTSR